MIGLLFKIHSRRWKYFSGTAVKVETAQIICCVSTIHMNEICPGTMNLITDFPSCIIHSALFFLDRKHISLLLYVYHVDFFCFYFTLLMSAGQTALFCWYNCNNFRAMYPCSETKAACVCASKFSYKHGPTTFWEVPWRRAVLSVWKFPLRGPSVNTDKPSSGMYYGHTWVKNVLVYINNMVFCNCY